MLSMIRQGVVFCLALLLIAAGFSRSFDGNREILEMLKSYHSLFQEESVSANVTNATSIAVTKVINSLQAIESNSSSNSTKPLFSFRDKIALFHVGKTGGTTLRDNLLRIGCRFMRNKRAKLACENRQSITTESRLSLATSMLFHYEVAFPNNARNFLHTAKGLLFTIREPLSRFESAYYFKSPFHCVTGKLCQSNQNKFKYPDDSNDFHAFYETFPTLGHIVDALQRSSPEGNATRSTNETKLLQKTFQSFGRMPGYGHLTAGYRYYAYTLASIRERMESNAAVLAIRTERLWPDAETIDAMVGGTGNFSALSNAKHTHGSENHINRTKIEDYGSRAAQHLCCALLLEIQAYRLIVDHAVNLNAQEKQETYEWTWKRCSVSNWEQLDEECHSMALKFD